MGEQLSLLKRILIALLLTFVCLEASPATIVQGQANFFPPEVATGFRSFTWHTVSSTGDRVVCPDDDWYQKYGKCADSAGRNRWVRLVDAIPPGKTYAGFFIDTFRDRVYVFWR